MVDAFESWTLEALVNHTYPNPSDVGAMASGVSRESYLLPVRRAVSLAARRISLIYTERTSGTHRSGQGWYGDASLAGQVSILARHAAGPMSCLGLLGIYFCDRVDVQRVRADAPGGYGEVRIENGEA